MRRCAVCGIVKSKDEFGDGVDCPKTTCLTCFKIAKAKARIEKAKMERAKTAGYVVEGKESSKKKFKPVDEFVRELKEEKQKKGVKKSEK